MFEASLVESTGQIRTRSRWFAAASFMMEAALLLVFIALPYLHPASLPKRSLVEILTPPSAPAAPKAPKAVVASGTTQPAMLYSLANARQTIRQASSNTGSTQNAPEAVGLPDLQSTGSVMGAVADLLGQPTARVLPPPPSRVRVSSGVAIGQLLQPIRPQYPAIARQAHVQGTVVVHAIISKSGEVKDAQVVSGPPLLAQAALNAIIQTRYRPYLLNGEPVELETTINVIFQLNE